MMYECMVRLCVRASKLRMNLRSILQSIPEHISLCFNLFFHFSLNSNNSENYLFSSPFFR